MYAGFWKRAGAYIIDSIIFSIAWTCLLFPFSNISFSFSATVFLSIAFLASWFFYFVYAEASAWQATLGKKILGIKVTDMHGYRISIVRSAGRHVSMALSLYTFCIGFLMCLWTKKEQCLHDMTSGCLVVTKEVQPSAEFPPTRPPLIMWFCLIIIPAVWLALIFLPFRTAYSYQKGVPMLENSARAQNSDKPTTPKPASFEEAIQRGDGESVSDYLQNGEDPNRKTKKGTPLISLARDVDTLSLLLQGGADVNATDGDGLTPLMHACITFVDENSYQYVKPMLVKLARVAERLIQAGADVNAVDSANRTALSHCSFWGNGEVASVLLKAGASPMIVDEKGNPPLIIAIKENHPRVIAALLQSRVSADTANYNGDAALVLAAKEGKAEVVHVLLAARANPDIQDKFGSTALIKAAQTGNVEIARMLLDAGANPNIQDKSGETALYWASLISNKDMVDLLIQAGAKPLLIDSKRGKKALVY